MEYQLLGKYLRLGISVHESVAMHEIKTLEQLKRDLLRFILGKRANHVSLKISKRKILHTNEHRLGALEPARGFHEASIKLKKPL